jgi:signal transduction histidine kinase
MPAMTLDERMRPATTPSDASRRTRTQRRKPLDTVLLGEQPLVAFDARSLQIVNANDAALERYKFARRQFVKLNLRDLHAPADVLDLVASLSNPPLLIADHGIWHQYDSHHVSFRCLLVSRELIRAPEQVRLLMVHELSEPPATSDNTSERGFTRNWDTAIAELDILRRGVRRLGHLLDQVQRQAHTLSASRDVSQPEHAALARLTLGIEESWRTCRPLARIATLRRTALRRTRVDLSRLLVSLLADHMALEPQRHIEIDIEPDMVVSADAVLLRDALDLIVGSSIRSTRTREVASIQFGHAVQDDQCVFFLRDNGVGVATEHGSAASLGTVDDPEAREESGLALASVKMAFAQHGGRLWIDTANDVGTTFYFTLPFADKSLQPRV